MLPIKASTFAIDINIEIKCLSYLADVIAHGSSVILSLKFRIVLLLSQGSTKRFAGLSWCCCFEAMSEDEGRPKID